ncbi:MAG: hypothetical protein SWL02_09975 [Pseudomonadota bacterium]|nr:hypothetical protein [Pseudomonadota bacterium]
MIKYEKIDGDLYAILNMPVIKFEIHTPWRFETDFGTGIKLLGIKVTDERWIPCALLHDLLRGLRSDCKIVINNVEQTCPWYLGVFLPFAIAPKRWQRFPMLAAIIAWEFIRPVKLFLKTRKDSI